jgi:hypothetical protein
VSGTVTREHVHEQIATDIAGYRDVVSDPRSLIVEDTVIKRRARDDARYRSVDRHDLKSDRLKWNADSGQVPGGTPGNTYAISKFHWLRSCLRGKGESGSDRE